MKNFLSRLASLETKIIPPKRTGMFFSRSGHQKEDLEWQLKEYQALHGCVGELVILDVGDGYVQEDYDDFELFLRNRRKLCPLNNPYCWW